jgi:phosphate transport system substrate-binding protein
MLKTLAAAATAVLLTALSANAAENISGAGATFPAPVYAKWAEAYKRESGVDLNYQAIGSGGGIKQITAKTVDFGASDKPLKPDQLNQIGLIQFPTVMGGVVPVVNLPGVAPGAMKLSGDLLAKIYLGEIRRWNDPAIEGLNGGMRLPNLPITVVHRSDGSGTTFVFTSYLTMKNGTWATKVGSNDAVEWPTGQGGKGNDGVSAFVRQTPGSIGYVEYAYAKQNHLTYTQMQTHDGSFVEPVAANFAAAASKADWAHTPGGSFYMLILDKPGATSWPITAATFILMYKHQDNPAKGQAVIKFFDWAFKHGDALAEQLDYIPLPEAVKAAVERKWQEIH